jgi:RNA polymerase sigma-70 factor (ECF subfamily)
MIEIQDNELLLHIKNDNQSAFEVIFLRYYSGLCSYASTILADRDNSEEIVQDTFVKFWENRNQLEINNSLKAYLYRTVHNQCLNQIESKKIRDLYSKNQMQAYEKSLTEIIPFSNDYPIANLIAQELEEKIQKSIETLPEQCKEVFLLIRIQKKSYQEVAQKLNISVNTVKTQMQRAVFKLKDMLQEYLPVIFIFLQISLMRN